VGQNFPNVNSTSGIGKGAMIEIVQTRIEAESASMRWQIRALVAHYQKNPDATVQLKVKPNGIIFGAYERARILGLLQFTNRRPTIGGEWVTATATDLMFFWARVHAVEKALVE
jgi:hypothetical protein